MRMRRKRRNYADLPSGRVMSISEAVAYLRAHQLPLHYDSRASVDVWTPRTKVPITLRRSIVKHKQELLAMMHQGDVKVCPASFYHEQFWHDDTCSMCKQLDEWVGGQYN